MQKLFNTKSKQFIFLLKFKKDNVIILCLILQSDAYLENSD